MTAPAHLLLVDDDAAFRQVLTRALEKRGYRVTAAADAAAASQLLAAQRFQFAVVDLRLPGDSGLRVVEQLRARAPAACVVVLTGYASIATAVEAIKLGATHYLTKPADADEIIAAFTRGSGDAQTAVTETPQSISRVEWEHINSVLSQCGGNISAAARQLNMHRRTLQRKLAKRPVKH